MGELRITPEQGTSQSRKPQAKPQTTKTGNIVIEFSSLPNNMKTAKVRAFYDKDGSGFLESKNANGKNEIALMQEAFGVNLSKYKSDITKVRTSKAKGNYWVSDCDNKTKYYPTQTTSVGYNDKNQKIVEIKHYQARDFNKNTQFSPELLASSQICEKRWTNNKLSADNIYSNDYKPQAIIKKENKNAIWQFFYNDGYLEMSGKGDLDCMKHSKAGLYNNQGKLIQNLNDDNKGNLYYSNNKYKKLTSGKNNLCEKETYKIFIKESENSRMNHSIKEVLQGESKTKVNSEYLLNGKPVKAKPIGKGRYEVTTEKGNVYYISHDGVNLKPEYVRQK